MPVAKTPESLSAIRWRRFAVIGSSLAMLAVIGCGPWNAFEPAPPVRNNECCAGVDREQFKALAAGKVIMIDPDEGLLTHVATGARVRVDAVAISGSSPTKLSSGSSWRDDGGIGPPDKTEEAVLFMITLLDKDPQHGLLEFVFWSGRFVDPGDDDDGNLCREQAGFQENLEFGFGYADELKFPDKAPRTLVVAAIVDRGDDILLGSQTDNCGDRFWGRELLDLRTGTKRLIGEPR